MIDCILDEVVEQPTRLCVKIDFLQHEKDNLQECVKQLSENIRVYKAIIEKLTNHQALVLNGESLASIVTSLQEINDRQAQRTETIRDEVQTLKCKILLKDQIMEEQEMEYSSVLKGYEQKILQLRRAIQDKEYAIQQKENPRTGGQTRNKKDYIMDPKHQSIKLNTQLEEYKELVRKLTLQNNEYKKKNSELSQQIAKSNHKITKLEALFSSQVPFHTARVIYSKAQRSALSEQKVNLKSKQQRPTMPLKPSDKFDISKQDTNFTKKRVCTSKVSGGINSYNQGYYIKNQSLGYMRQLLFKQKQHTQQLTKALNQLNINYAGLVNSNKLLSASNVNYQAKRAKLQAELNMYKKKNQQLLSIVMKKKVKLNKSMDQPQAQVVLSQIKPQAQVQHNDIQLNQCLKHMQGEIQMATSTLARVTTRGFFQRVKNHRKHISFSCPIDYTPKQQLDSVEQFIKKQQQKLYKKQENKQRDEQPFLVDMSVIKPDKQQPLTFADYAFKKRKIISQSFMQITEEILRH